MTEKMRAWVLEKYNSSLVLKNVPVPVVGDNDVLVKVKAAGVCGTDFKIYTGKLDGIIKLPHIMGHEGAGEIVEAGRSVKNLKPGDRGIIYHYIACRDCELCRTGRENICLGIKRTGFELDGAFGEYVSIPAYNFCKVENTAHSWHELAILPDAVLTPYHSLKTLGKVSAGKKVLIIGLGGLGLHGVQITSLFGASAAGVDIRDESLSEASRLGAELVINSGEEDPAEKLLDWTGGNGVDLIVDGVGTSATFPWALKTLKKGGKLVLMGYDPKNPLPLDALGMHYNEWEIIGSRLGTKQELAELIDYLDKGRIKPLVSMVLEMKEVNRVFSEAMIEKISGRIVFNSFNRLDTSV